MDILTDVFRILCNQGQLFFKYKMKKFNVEVKWGVTFVIAQLIWIAFEKIMGWHDEHIDVQGVYSLFFAVIAFLIY